jgi:hypothetical protein
MVWYNELFKKMLFWAEELSVTVAAEFLAGGHSRRECMWYTAQVLFCLWECA